MFKRPSVYLGILVVSWGSSMTGTGFVKDFCGLMVVRSLLGMLETPRSIIFAHPSQVSLRSASFPVRSISSPELATVAFRIGRTRYRIPFSTAHCFFKVQRIGEYAVGTLESLDTSLRRNLNIIYRAPVYIESYQSQLYNTPYEYMSPLTLLAPMVSRLSQPRSSMYWKLASLFEFGVSMLENIDMSFMPSWPTMP